MKAMAPKGVVLDLDDTLYFYQPCNASGNAALFAFLATQLKVRGGEVEAAFLRARKKVHATLKNTGASHSRLLYIQKCIETLTGKTDVLFSLKAEEIFWREYFKKMKLVPGAFDFLKAAKKRGVKIAIVSDLTAQIQMRKIIRLGIARYVDVLVTSEESGKEKPALDSFRAALKKLKLPAHAVVCIGDDHKKDFLAARHAGMMALHADSFDKLKESFFK